MREEEVITLLTGLLLGIILGILIGIGIGEIKEKEKSLREMSEVVDRLMKAAYGRPDLTQPPPIPGERND